jgi:hypothetical protein
VPLGDGAISRAVALALRTRLGRGGSRKWGVETGTAGGEYELDSGVFCGVWERAALLEVGGWDERFTRNQDSEMAGRFLARGERLVCLPAMAANYTPRRSLGGLWRQYFEYGQFRALTAGHHPHTLRRSALLPPAVVLAGVVSLLPSSPVRGLSRTALALYGLVLGAAGAGALADADPPRDALVVPVVLPVMHLAHGSGFLAGCVRHGPPLAALAGAAGLTALADRLEPAPMPVYAPALHGESAAV